MGARNVAEAGDAADSIKTIFLDGTGRYVFGNIPGSASDMFAFTRTPPADV